MRAAFLNHNHLVERELIGALRRVPGLTLVVVNAPTFSTAQQAGQICAALEKQQCSVLFTIDDWGLDVEEHLSEFLEKRRPDLGGFSTREPTLEGWHPSGQASSRGTGTSTADESAASG